MNARVSGRGISVWVKGETGRDQSQAGVHPHSRGASHAGERLRKITTVLLATCVGTLLSACAASSGAGAEVQARGQDAANTPAEKNYLNAAEALDEFYKQRQQPSSTRPAQSPNVPTNSSNVPNTGSTAGNATQPGTVTPVRTASTSTRERSAATPERPARVYPAPSEPRTISSGSLANAARGENAGGELEANTGTSLGGGEGAANEPVNAMVPNTKAPTETSEQKRQRLITELVELAAVERAAANEENVALRRAVKMVLASALAGEGASALSRADVQTASLPPRDAAAVDALRELIRESQNPSVASDGAALSRVIERAAAKASASQGLSVAQLQLCTRVDGYGKYVSLDGAPIVAGKPLMALVYTEVENFTQTSAGTGGEYSVNLSQEVRLYTEAGTAVWSRPKQVARDSSKNRRRDYFLVQRIEIPGNLAPGRYDLKVTVRDEDANAVSERSVPITIVADTTSKTGVPTRTR
ncbi:MAG: hypothetical protein IBJ18_04585 [Phycisphaerales bacterium]|nr:hypothetical protein [Phycisphaerales bacterium]